jgi:Amt family ammonium transporter
LFFNGGSTNDLFVPRANGPAKIIMNTVISGSAGGIVAVFVKPHFLGTYSFVSKYDCCSLCNGILIGLVSVTGCCDRIEPWAACLIGAIGALFYVFGCKVLDYLHVDDPVEAAPVHMFGGIWGTIATGIFDNQMGLLYEDPGKGRFFGYQILAIIAVMAWVGTTASITFYIMNRLGFLRVDKAIEIIGLDIAEMGGLSEEIYDRIRKDLGLNQTGSPKNNMRNPSLQSPNQ